MTRGVHQAWGSPGPKHVAVVHDLYFHTEEKLKEDLL